MEDFKFNKKIWFKGFDFFIVSVIVGQYRVVFYLQNNCICNYNDLFY